VNEALVNVSDLPPVLVNLLPSRTTRVKAVRRDDSLSLFPVSTAKSCTSRIRGVCKDNPAFGVDKFLERKYAEEVYD